MNSEVSPVGIKVYKMDIKRKGMFSNLATGNLQIVQTLLSPTTHTDTHMTVSLVSTLEFVLTPWFLYRSWNVQNMLCLIQEQIEPLAFKEGQLLGLLYMALSFLVHCDGCPVSDSLTPLAQEGL